MQGIHVKVDEEYVIFFSFFVKCYDWKAMIFTDAGMEYIQDGCYILAQRKSQFIDNVSILIKKYRVKYVYGSSLL